LRALRRKRKNSVPVAGIDALQGILRVEYRRMNQNGRIWQSRMCGDRVGEMQGFLTKAGKLPTLFPLDREKTGVFKTRTFDLSIEPKNLG
jgi:hypothetical protein